jgi:hypothetical protein
VRFEVEIERFYVAIITAACQPCPAAQGVRYAIDPAVFRDHDGGMNRGADACSQALLPGSDSAAA